MEELIGVAIPKKDGLMSKEMVPHHVVSHGRFMRIKMGGLVNFSLSSRHTYNLNNILVIVQAICANTNDSSVRYHVVIPKNNDIVLFDLKYVKAEDNSYLDLYISCSDPIVTLLSTDDTSLIEFVNEAHDEFPPNAIDAIEV